MISTTDDDELLQAVLGYLKKKNLGETEAALRKEADIQGDEDSLHVDKMKQVIQQEFTKGYTLVFRILTTAVATLLGILIDS